MGTDRENGKDNTERANEGVWCVCDFDYGDSITMVFPTEIEALRGINGRGYGTVRFVPFGMSLNDLDIAERSK